MTEQELLNALQSRDDKAAYALFKTVNAASAQADTYYPLVCEFARLTTHASSFVRTRGFALRCAQARWDREGKLAQLLPMLLPMLHDEKPTAVRQCLRALHELALYRPGLSDTVLAALDTLDADAYGESMAPLIKKDIKALRASLGQ